MTKNLVIVESPSKSKTIEKYLGKDYKVLSSKGHIRDLATTGKYGFGIDVDNNFEPSYIPIKGKKKFIDELKKETKASDFVFLATDPDREGEAISWHLKDALSIDEDKYQRVVFNEITKDVVRDAFNHAGKIDDNLVKSQETRRMLDRIIGFRLSKLMQAKTGGRSAGRVQSVALKLIVDREREIEKFVEEEYWSIEANFNTFEASLDTYNYKKIEIKNELEADEIISKLTNAFKIADVSKKQKKKQSKVPYITSTLQQDANTKLNFIAKKTMSLAQKLYEGINVGKETTGLITYMRTDSIRLSDEFCKNTFKYIKIHYGEEYVGRKKFSTSKVNVQDAHEAIRPTNINYTPDSIKDYLTSDEYKLYSLIYARALSSLMADAKVDATTVILDNNNYQFKATGQTIIFDGYLKVYQDYEKNEDKILPPFETYKSNIIVASAIEKNQHFTKPPARYTEAKLIEEMEKLGIGRPSTYAKIIDTLTERNYVFIIEKKFNPTEIGVETTDKLQEFFSGLINVKYTANMETALDEIAIGKKEWLSLLKEFYGDFDSLINDAYNKMEKKQAVETGENCPECGSPLVERKGKYGKFISCSGYPKCKYIKADKKEIKLLGDCPKCEGKIVEKKTKKGKIFYGCNNYPKCDFALWDKPLFENCPECGSMLVEKKSGIACSQCQYKK